MASYKITYQIILKGQINATNTISVSANSEKDARNKFKATHAPSSQRSYKIISIVG